MCRPRLIDVLRVMARSYSSKASVSHTHEAGKDHRASHSAPTNTSEAPGQVDGKKELKPSGREESNASCQPPPKAAFAMAPLSAAFKTASAEEKKALIRSLIATVNLPKQQQPSTSQSTASGVIEMPAPIPQAANPTRSQSSSGAALESRAAPTVEATASAWLSMPPPRPHTQHSLLVPAASWTKEPAETTQETKHLHRGSSKNGAVLANVEAKESRTEMNSRAKQEITMLETMTKDAGADDESDGQAQLDVPSAVDKACEESASGSRLLLGAGHVVREQSGIVPHGEHHGVQLPAVGSEVCMRISALCVVWMYGLRSWRLCLPHGVIRWLCLLHNVSRIRDKISLGVLGHIY
jgi:hypothetical protein